ncbi:MAG: lysophospholipid acyltransferase family protein [Acidobacteriota bacterium]
MKSYFLYLIAKIVILFIRLVPRPVAEFFVRTLAVFAYYVDFRHRRIASTNLKIAFPEFSEKRRNRIARASFQNIAMNLVEISRFPRLNRGNIGKLVQYDQDYGLANYQSALSKGKGILYLTGHFSAWELLPAAHALYGHPLSFVTRPLDNTALDRYLQKLRESVGNRVIHKKDAARTILKCLKKKESAGILMDQNTSLQEGTFADFFGVPAATTTGLVLIALLTGAPIVPGYLTLQREGKYTIKFLPPVEVERTGDRNRDIAVNTKRLNRILEGIVREQPEAWLWGHKRWKYQPHENPGDLYAMSDVDLDEFLSKKTSRAKDT